MENKNQIIQVKLEQLDKNYNFNKKKIDFEYLVELNKFLYGNMNNKDNLVNSDIDENKITIINYTIEKITKCFLDYNNNEFEIKWLLKRLVDLKPFVKGNEDTMLGLFNVLCSIYSIVVIEDEKNKPLKNC